MKKDYLFQIKNLVCSYDGRREVLKVESLEIPKGKIVILLGVSGSGKSTVLETLGLMNRTIKNSSQLDFCPNGETIDLSELWRNKQNKKIAEIRKNHFSFIFQNTNLMPNFTAYENISITQMIDGLSKREAILRAKELAETLSLEINKTKKAFEMSGGEKQRAAFIRAVAPDFTILFGDEPTGNLDKKNASDLFLVLRKTILNKNKTAIIVSHDVEMAMRFADVIILIQKIVGESGQEYGLISRNKVFTSPGVSGKQKIWLDKNGADITGNIMNMIDAVLK